MAPVIYHPDYQIPLRDGHRFPMSKYGYLHRLLLERGLLGPGRHIAPELAGDTTLARAHDTGYVTRVLSNTLLAEETRRIGLPDTAAVTRRARLAASGTLLAATIARRQGLAINAAGGSHHAARDWGAGYCVFNDVAIASAALLSQGIGGPVLIIDADVHQGDGTARIFEGDSRVFTFSIHGEKNFPARKVVSDLDIGLPDGIGDEAYLEALERGVGQALAIAPAIVFYNAGVDVCAHDRLGRLGLSLDGLRARDRLVLRRVRAAGLPLACVLGGGYGEAPEVAERHAVLFEEAAAL
ncbi:MAG: histone deacetylase [Pseudomonadota bacterium]